MSFRSATSGWEAGDATGSFSLHGSPDGREKLGQQPAPPGADPRKTAQPDELTVMKARMQWIRVLLPTAPSLVAPRPALDPESVRTMKKRLLQ